MRCSDYNIDAELNFQGSEVLNQLENMLPVVNRKFVGPLPGYSRRMKKVRIFETTDLVEISNITQYLNLRCF